MNARSPDRTAGARVAAMAAWRRADTERRRQRVLKALETAAGTGEEISVSATARWALLTAPSSTGTATYSPRSTPARPCRPPCRPPGRQPGPRSPGLAASRLARRPRALRPPGSRIRQLEHRLSDALGEQVWRESGLGQPDDIVQLKQQVTHLAEENHQLRGSLAERDQDLAAARAAGRELMARLNTRS